VSSLRATCELDKYALPNLSESFTGVVHRGGPGDLRRHLRSIPARRKRLL